MNIDECYKFVQLIANKEQGGFITPKDFNLAMDAAQMEFYNDRYGQPSTYQPNNPSPVVGYPQSEKVQGDLRPFITYAANLKHSSPLPDDFMYAVEFNVSNNWQTVKYIQRQDLNDIVNSTMLEPNDENVYVYNIDDMKLGVYPRTNSRTNANTAVTMVYLRKPKKPIWNYRIDENDRPVYAKDGGLIFNKDSINRLVPLPDRLATNLTVSPSIPELGSGVFRLPAGAIIRDGVVWQTVGTGTWQQTLGFKKDIDGNRPLKYGQLYTLEYEVLDIGDPAYPGSGIVGSRSMTEGTGESAIFVNGREVIVTGGTTANTNYWNATGWRGITHYTNYVNSYVTYKDTGEPLEDTTAQKYEIVFTAEYTGGGMGASGMSSSFVGQRNQLGFYIYKKDIKLSNFGLYETDRQSHDLEFRAETHLEIIFRALGYLGIHLSEQTLTQYAEGKQTPTPGV